jgi:hypothetical protein
VDENRRRRALDEPRRQPYGARVRDRGNVLDGGCGRVVRRHAERASGFMSGARVIDPMDRQQRLGNEQDGEQCENADAMPAGTNPCQQRRTCARSAHLARESTVLASRLAEPAGAHIA